MSELSCQLKRHEFRAYPFCRYGEKAAEAASEGLDAAGHAVGTAWAAFKIRKALNPKNSFKATVLAKAAAKATVEEAKAKGKK